MLIIENLRKRLTEVKPIFNLLFEAAIKNQIHKGDLLLVNISAGYTQIEQFDAKKDVIIKKEICGIGIGTEGIIERTIIDFINGFINHYGFTGEQVDVIYNDYFDKLYKQNIPDNHELIFSLQIEKLVYLKIWESNKFLYRLNQLSKILNRERFDWRAKVPLTSKHIFFRTFRDSLKVEFPDFFAILSKAFKTQIRNAIAHSQFYFVGNRIVFEGYEEYEEGQSVPSITFEEWDSMFLETIVLFISYNEFMIKIDEYYRELEKNTYKQGIKVRFSNNNHPVLTTKCKIGTQSHWDFKCKSCQSNCFIK